MGFMDRTRCRAVAVVARSLAPWINARHEKWGKQGAVVFEFLGVDAGLMPIHGAWTLGGATGAGEAIGEWLPASIGVTTSDGGTGSRRNGARKPDGSVSRARDGRQQLPGTPDRSGRTLYGSPGDRLSVASALSGLKGAEQCCQGVGGLDNRVVSVRGHVASVPYREHCAHEFVDHDLTAGVARDSSSR
ncbi:MAG: hypothetical protein QOI98_3146 [Solirubrobacteraceae bacterium]|nr:hypothetical protein [Solirubrobacteraceae bacterium]